MPALVHIIGRVLEYCVSSVFRVPKISSETCNCLRAAFLVHADAAFCKARRLSGKVDGTLRTVCGSLMLVPWQE
jgi:hypothetical protein